MTFEKIIIPLVAWLHFGPAKLVRSQWWRFLGGEAVVSWLVFVVMSCCFVGWAVWNNDPWCLFLNWGELVAAESLPWWRIVFKGSWSWESHLKMAFDVFIAGKRFIIASSKTNWMDHQGWRARDFGQLGFARIFRFFLFKGLFLIGHI